MVKIDKKLGVIGLGAGVSVLQVVGFNAWIDPLYPLIPGIGPYLGPNFGRISVGGNIIIGSVALGLSFIKKIGANAKNFLIPYGAGCLIGGVALGLTYNVPAAGLRRRVPPRAGLAARARREVPYPIPNVVTTSQPGEWGIVPPSTVIY